MSDFLQRLVDERQQLQEKFDKLKTFIDLNDVFNSLNQEQQSLLKIQASAMFTYLCCLNERIFFLSPQQNN